MQLLSRLRSRATQRYRAACPAEEALASYLGGSLTASTKRDLESHLADCAYCMDDLVGAYRCGEELQVDQAPQFLLEKARALVPGRKPVFDIVVRLTQGTLELIRATVPVSRPMFAVNLRRGGPGPGRKVLQLSKAMGRLTVTAELEAVEEGMCQLDVHVKDELGRPAEGIRLSLLSKGREQASLLTPAAGEIVFERILPADYQIAVMEVGGLVGAIELRLTRDL